MLACSPGLWVRPEALGEFQIQRGRMLVFVVEARRSVLADEVLRWEAKISKVSGVWCRTSFWMALAICAQFLVFLVCNLLSNLRYNGSKEPTAP